MHFIATKQLFILLYVSFSQQGIVEFIPFLLRTAYLTDRTKGGEIPTLEKRLKQNKISQSIRWLIGRATCFSLHVLWNSR